ncbi:MAG: maleylacetoacetate isomerase [Aestuariibacter sp.]
MKLYSYWRSSASYRVRIALNLKGIEYEYHPVHLVKDGGEQHSEEYLCLNPGELVPTLVDKDNENDIVLNQSLAIIEYLDERFPEVNRLVPEHKLDRARVRTLSYDIACDAQPIANLRVLQQLGKDFNASDEQKAQWARGWIERAFHTVEKRLQNTAADYCFGFSISMADVVLVPQYFNARRFNVDMSAFPLIENIVNRCNEQQAFIEAMPENQPDAQ